MSTRVTSFNRWRQLSRRLVELLLPPACANCKRAGALICEECAARIAWVKPPVCMRCGRVTPAVVIRCRWCRKRPFPLRQIRAAVLFDGPVPAIIHQFKYNGAFALAEPIAGWMASTWSQWQFSADLLLPVPLHRERERERGYNQAALIVTQLAHKIDRPANNSALRRVRYTQPQARLKAEARQDNVQGAFRADAAQVSGKEILLIDDVYTTGATLREAGLALIEAGARAVSGFCAAQALAP